MTNNMVPDDELMIVGGSTIRYVPGLVNIQKKLWKITIFHGIINYKWPFSMVMLVYQRVLG